MRSARRRGRSSCTSRSSARRSTATPSWTGWWSRKCETRSSSRTQRPVIWRRVGADNESMRGRALIVAVALIAGGCGGEGGCGGPAAGRIGAVPRGQTTGAGGRGRRGSPDGVIGKMDPAMPAPHGGRTIVYLCGKDCRTEYSFNNDTKALSDFWTQSSKWTTERGSRPGMPATRAAKLEGKKIGPGCSGNTIFIRNDRNRAYVLVSWKDKIDTITYLGPHSTYYDGLC